MNRRFQTILDLENLSPAQLADRLGVQRSGISHILSGRNKPSFELLQRVVQSFPEISAEWLITGNGKPLKEQNQAAASGAASGAASSAANSRSSGTTPSTTPSISPSTTSGSTNSRSSGTISGATPPFEGLFNSSESATEPQIPAQTSDIEGIEDEISDFQPLQSSIFDANPANDREKRALKRVILIYNDNTFEELLPPVDKKR
ncbi:MAG: helix-turn-helix transcriptional regulator [Candidatus Egerieousia sp.]|nr:helix-turn-helix transcriptional regulator [bacterium]MDY5255861.1 helix-turn-helix transcriptional regulator [Candidatus Egerieousia sp.]